jgi:hypothetical protein
LPEDTAADPERPFENRGRQESATGRLVNTALKKRAGISDRYIVQHLSQIFASTISQAILKALQLLGHKNIKMTANFYAGHSRRAARHHHRLIDQALEDQARVPRGAKRPMHNVKLARNH